MKITEDMKVYRKAYRQKPKVKAYNRKYQREWQRKNRNLVNEKQRAIQHLKNKWLKEWRAKNHFKVIVANRNRRQAVKDLTIETIQKVYEDSIKQYGTLTCYLCVKPIEFGKDALEHKIPLCRGGTNKIENLGVACKTCNSRKGTKTEIEYRKGIGESFEDKR